MKKMLVLFFITSILVSNTFAQQDVKPVRRGIPGEHPGEIIAPISDSQIAAWCDFEKQIILTRTGVLCVYKGSPEPNTGARTP